MRDSDPITRLTAARFDGPQALFTTAVAMLTERPALPDDLAEIVEGLLDAGFDDAADAIEALTAENARLSASGLQCAVVKPLAFEDVLKIIETTEPASMTSDGDRIWTRRMAEAIHSRILSVITLRPEAEVRAEAWAAALEAAANAAHDRTPEKHGGAPLAAHYTGASIENAIRAMITDDASAALDRIKAEAKAEGMREAARICDRYCEDDALRAPAGWSEDEVSMWNCGGLDHLMAARDAILAAITEGHK